jgi:lipoyl(octanoyl) transferase
MTEARVLESMTSEADSLGPLAVYRLGRRDYREVWAFQKELHQSLIEGTGKQALVVCEHPPVITLGTSSTRSSIRSTDSELRELGLELIEVERGGNVTFHGPGQLVAYPILDLKLHRRDIGWYMRLLEQCVIDTLADYRLAGHRIEGKTGVWIPGESARKIASLGVKLSRWVSYHGIAMNFRDNRVGFSHIDPCGLLGIETTSIEREWKERPGTIAEARNLPPLDLAYVGESFISHFSKNFGFSR